VGALVSLLCDDQNVEMALEDEGVACAKEKIEFVSFGPAPCSTDSKWRQYRHTLPGSTLLFRR